MSEFRNDPLSGSWVIIAENRAARPDQFDVGTSEPSSAPCPFCEGNEYETPDPVAIYPPAGPAANPIPWQVRVVPNKYPAVTWNEEPVTDGSGIPACVPALGAHEVVIESPRHIKSISEATDAQIEYTFAAYQDRLRFWRQDQRLDYGLVFKNVRAAGGASLEHAHAQLIATTMLPPIVAREVQLCGDFHARQAKCLLCDLIHRELSVKQRIVEVTEGLVAVCPFASRFPYEILVLPRDHASAFEGADVTLRNELAHLVRRIVARLEAVVPTPAYNFWIHTAPWRKTLAPGAFHWHLHLAPRLTRWAGFELGAGYFINPLSPEKAAEHLRTASFSL